MPFVMHQGRVKRAYDPDTNSQMLIKSGPEISFQNVFFESSALSFKVGINIQEKFPDRPVITDDPTNPCVMLVAEDFNRAFSKLNMLDYDFNTKVAEYVIRMIAFINKNVRLANSPFLWSNSERICLDKWLYRMPTDDMLLKISIEPEMMMPGYSNGIV